MSENSESYSRRSRRPVDLSEWEVRAFHVAESFEQGAIIRVVFSSLEELIRRRGWTRVLPGADNYFAWIPEHPMVRVSPDAYLLDDPPERIPKMWQTWLPGNPPPRWALEIVSERWRKDYDDAPLKYEELGCRELVVFDPDALAGQTTIARRVPLTVYRRNGEGGLEQVYRGPGPAFSRELDVWLVGVMEGYSPRLRLSEDAEGTHLVPTCAETNVRHVVALKKALAERTQAWAEREQARSEKELAEAEKEREREEKELAEAEKARAEAEKEREREEKERAEAEGEKERVLRKEAEARVAKLERKLRAKKRS